MYEDAEGVPRDYAEAVKWYRLSADQGLADAQYKLGVMYVNGRGVPKDYSEAARLYHLAADQGNGNGQLALGSAYAAGKGVPKDYAQAYFWFTLAAVHAGNPVVAKLRDWVEKNLTPEQVAEAQRLAREWKPKDAK
jgi:TPR repeat protein